MTLPSTCRRLSNLMLCLPLLAFTAMAAEQKCGAPGHARELIVACTRVIDKHPKAEQLQVALLSRSLSYAALGDWPKAMTDAQAAAVKDPKDARPWSMMGLYHGAQKMPAEAEDDFAHAQALNPDSVWVWISRSFADEMDRRYDKAVADLTRAAELRPNDPNIYCNRARDYDRLASYAQAMADDDEILRLDPASKFGLVNRSYNELHRNQAPAAIKDANRALDLFHDNAGAHIDRARAEIEEGDFQAALADYTFVKDHNPASAEGWNGEAYVRHLLGSDDLAMAGYQHVLTMSFPAPSISDDPYVGTLEDTTYSALSLAILNPVRGEPKYMAAHNGLSSLALAKGDTDAAIREAELAVSDSPEGYAGYRTRGNSEFAKGQWDIAEKDYAQAVANFPESPYAALWRYLAAERGGRDGKPDLRTTLMAIKSADWPMPVGLYLLGEEGEAALQQDAGSAAGGSAYRAKELQCETDFYLGEAALIAGDKASAARWFNAAVATKVIGYIEYSAAQRELQAIH